MTKWAGSGRVKSNLKSQVQLDESSNKESGKTSGADAAITRLAADCVSGWAGQE